MSVGLSLSGVLLWKDCFPLDIHLLAGCQTFDVQRVCIWRTCESFMWCQVVEWNQSISFRGGRTCSCAKRLQWENTWNRFVLDHPFVYLHIHINLFEGYLIYCMYHQKSAWCPRMRSFLGTNSLLWHYQTWVFDKLVMPCPRSCSEFNVFYLNFIRCQVVGEHVKSICACLCTLPSSYPH